MKYITKKAYIQGLAARGCLRYLAMQKQATKSPTDVGVDRFRQLDEDTQKELLQRSNLDKGFKGTYRMSNLAKNTGGKTYAMIGLGTAGAGAALGALIAAARKKNILAGSLIGGASGAGLGLAGKYVNDKYIYPKSLSKLDFNAVDYERLNQLNNKLSNNEELSESEQADWDALNGD